MLPVIPDNLFIQDEVFWVVTPCSVAIGYQHFIDTKSFYKVQLYIMYHSITTWTIAAQMV